MTSPYRQRVGQPNARRSLSFYHARLVFTSLLAFGLLALGALLVTTPRQVTLQCEPLGRRSMRCTTWMRSFWGEHAHETTRVEGGSDAGWLDEAPTLYVEIAYERRRGDSWSRIVAHYGRQPPVDLTEGYPTRFGGPTLRRLFAFREELDRGEPATLRITSGWGGELYAVLTASMAFCLLFVSSGRTRIVVDPRAERVTVESRTFWFFAKKRRVVPLEDVVSVVVTAEPAARGRTVYLPALGTKSGAVIHLGSSGLSVPDRAEHWAHRVSELVGVPVRGRPRGHAPS